MGLDAGRAKPIVSVARQTSFRNCAGLDMESSMNRKLLRIAGILILLSGMHSYMLAQGPDDHAASPEAPGTPQRSGPTSLPGGYQFPNARERFHNYRLDTVGPRALLYVAGRAGIAQLWDDPTEWHGDIGGYGRRLASAFGNSLIKKTMEYGLNETLHRDSQYYRCSRQGFLPRLGHAMKSTVTARNQEGRYVFSVPALAANYTAEILVTTTWYPDRYSYKDGIRNGNWSLLGRFGINVVREFVFRH